MPCAVQLITRAESVDAKQMEKLKSRKRLRADLSEPEKWKEVYTILFPDDDLSNIPPPCM
jgi:hypothetical protein